MRRFYKTLLFVKSTWRLHCWACETFVLHKSSLPTAYPYVQKQQVFANLLNVYAKSNDRSWYVYAHFPWAKSQDAHIRVRLHAVDLASMALRNYDDLLRLLGLFLLKHLANHICTQQALTFSLHKIDANRNIPTPINECSSHSNTCSRHGFSVHQHLL